jgi:hypothetical protein
MKASASTILSIFPPQPPETDHPPPPTRKLGLSGANFDVRKIDKKLGIKWLLTMVEDLLPLKW